VSEIPITDRRDVERARTAARDLAREQGYDDRAAERVVLATLELATNLLRYGHEGVIVLSTIESHRGRGIQVESRDSGPGIPDVARALEDGYSTGGGLGDGLPAVRRLAGEFDIVSSPEGTRVTARLWPVSR
jgi:serine/threonine-protein kinase RsbT